MWDLMRGKGCASTKLGKGIVVPLHVHAHLIVVLEGEVVRWSVGGDLFVVQSGQDMDIYNTVSIKLAAYPRC